MLNIGLAQLEAVCSQAVVFSRAVLFYIATGLQGCQNTENVVFMQIQPFAQLGHAQLPIAVELFQHIQGMDHGLDDIVAFFTADHASSSKGNDDRVNDDDLLSEMI